MTQMDFPIEFNSNLNAEAEEQLFSEADRRLRKLRGDHTDMVGAAINVRRPGKGESDFIFEVTVVVYTRPEHVAATEKRDDALSALKGALSAVERQVRKRREKLKKRWQQPGNDPVSQEVIETLLAEEGEEGLIDDGVVEEREGETFTQDVEGIVVEEREGE